MADGGGHQLTQFGGIPFLRLPGARQQDSAGRHSRRVVQEGEFQGFTGHLAALKKAVGAESLLLASLETQNDYSISVHLSKRFVIYRDIHHYRFSRKSL